MRRTLPLATLATVLLLPAVAAAKPTGSQRSHATARHTGAKRHVRTRASSVARRASRDPAAVALTIAERYWGAVPCGGQIAVGAEQAVPSGLDATTDAWVTFGSALGADDLTAPASTYTHCAIGLARWQWPTSAVMRSDWGMFCLTIVHEVGHLLGHAHSLAPGSVMAPVFTDESDVPAICRATTA